jgi:hypothetical protein
VDLVICEWVEHGGDERKIGRRFAASDVHAGGIQVEGKGELCRDGKLLLQGSGRGGGAAGGPQ